MQKDDLKSLVTHIYENLLDNIDNQDSANKEQVVTYLKEAVDVVESISNDNINSIEHAKSAFDNAYRELANRSISSYESTNSRFEELTQLHEKTLISCSDIAIDIPTITEKFNEIQSHMVDEVQKANTIINQLSEQVKELEKDSNLDGLTKVFNRRAMSSYLKKVCSTQNTHYNMHLLMLDIDDFKSINDTYGHVAGDKVLIFLSNILKKTLRDGDKVFRYGGEEFVVTLNRLSHDECKIIALRLIELVRESKLIYKGETLKVTISMGSTILQDHDTPDSFIARADKGLYKAKNSGKNKMYSELKNGI